MTKLTMHYCGSDGSCASFRVSSLWTFDVNEVTCKHCQRLSSFKTALAAVSDPAAFDNCAVGLDDEARTVCVLEGTAMTVEVGDTVTNFLGEKQIVGSLQPPRESHQSGRISIKKLGSSYYVSVFKCEFITASERAARLERAQG